jgi:small-conductance mechanosensitive channel
LPPLFKELLADPFAVIVPTLLLGGTLLAGLLLRKLLFRLVTQWAARTGSHLDVLLIGSLRGPIVLWALILGLHLATQNSQIPRPYLRYVPPSLEVLWILSLTIAMAHLAGNIVRFYAGHVRGAQAVTSLTQKLAQVAVVLLGTVWTLRVVFNLNLTPILTTLGVGGLAVALALQDTLSNLFAGFYVSISGLVRIGDYIKLNTGEEGFVGDINWRCTTLRSGTNNLIVIPNAKLGQAIFTNYFLPDRHMGGAVAVNVSYDADIDHVEKILREEAAIAAGQIIGMLQDPAPGVDFSPGPGEMGLGFQVNFQAAGFTELGPVQSELRRRLYRRLKREGIGMVPARVIHSDMGQAAGEAIPRPVSADGFSGPDGAGGSRGE